MLFRLGIYCSGYILLRDIAALVFAGSKVYVLDPASGSFFGVSLSLSVVAVAVLFLGLSCSALCPGWKVHCCFLGFYSLCFFELVYFLI